ncbi:hypothetical protein SS50377_28206 [Spironucleus salmonicida]|uniref:Uncharacterized protein n=1 Tax=Spironucleus salmonicida TaxID=348837 RepID=V6LQ37_9EUKA|nr:hypothetical protein SS50377_28206 [Spironucleus salmonicida]|eukprot:EST46358.1 Hypothetical protein SS50377_13601 [Spironucleus salmonicida]
MIIFAKNKQIVKSQQIDQPILQNLLNTTDTYFATDFPAFPNAFKSHYLNSTFIYMNQFVQISTISPMMDHLCQIFYFYYANDLPKDSDDLIISTLNYLKLTIMSQTEIAKISSSFRPFVVQKSNSIVQKLIYEDYNVLNNCYCIYHSVQYKNLCLSEIGAPKFVFGLLHRILHSQDRVIQREICTPVFDEIIGTAPQTWILDKNFDFKGQADQLEFSPNSSFQSKFSKPAYLIFSQKDDISCLKIVTGTLRPEIILGTNIVEMLNQQKYMNSIQMIVTNSIETLEKLDLRSGEIVFQNNKLFCISNLTLQMDLVESIIKNLYFKENEKYENLTSDSQIMSIGYNLYVGRTENCIVISQRQDMEIDIFNGL